VTSVRDEKPSRGSAATLAADELYIGYLPEAPPSHARFVRRVVVALVAFASALAIVLAALQSPFDAGSFDFARESAAIGVVRVDPAPMLVPDAPAGAPSPKPALLVEPFKHGARAEASEHDGRRVELRAHPIASPDGEMLELVPGSIVAQESGIVPPSAPERLGRFRLRGELVDSKCYLGVMKPGRGKPHRGCAARCLSGGIPPLLLVEDEAGGRLAILVAARDGSPLPMALLERVGEAIELEGEVERVDGMLTLRLDA
jgi:hypothetical protein